MCIQVLEKTWRRWLVRRDQKQASIRHGEWVRFKATACLTTKPLVGYDRCPRAGRLNVLANGLEQRQGATVKFVQESRPATNRAWHRVIVMGQREVLSTVPITCGYRLD
jgi:hypothetical protein